MAPRGRLAERPITEVPSKGTRTPLWGVLAASMTSTASHRAASLTHQQTHGHEQPFVVPLGVREHVLQDLGSASIARSPISSMLGSWGSRSRRPIMSEEIGTQFSRSRHGSLSATNQQAKLYATRSNNVDLATFAYSQSLLSVLVSSGTARAHLRGPSLVSNLRCSLY